METKEKLKEVLNDLCDWIQKETKKTSSNQAKSILPAVVEATTHLADLILRFYQ